MATGVLVLDKTGHGWLEVLPSNEALVAVAATIVESTGCSPVGEAVVSTRSLVVDRVLGALRAARPQRLSTPDGSLGESFRAIHSGLGGSLLLLDGAIAHLAVAVDLSALGGAQ